MASDRRAVGKFTSSIKQTITDDGKESLSKIILSSSKYLGVTIAKTDEEIAERLSQLFNDCVENQDIPTFEKMALCLGISRQTLVDWAVGNTHKGSARSYIINQAKQAAHSIEADLALRGYIPSAVYIFRGKNYYGMSDSPQQPFDATPTDSLDDNVSEVISKYTENLPTIDVSYTPVDD